MKVAINGAGIAGPTLAYWLRKSGHEVLLVEEAPKLRTGGYVVDFWGIGYDVAEKMGVIPQIMEQGYQVQEVRFVDRNGEKSGGFPADVFSRMTRGRYTSLRRSDLAAVIFRALDASVETVFGDSITGIEDEGQSLGVTFLHAAPREVDLVIGADGLHSRVRQVVMEQEGVENNLGYHVAAFEAAGYRPRDELVYVSYGLPGRQVSRFSMRNDITLFLFVFRDEYFTESGPSNEEQQKGALSDIFGDLGWECREIIAALRDAAGIYFDRVSQIRMKRWSKGRVALVGDAAACVSLLAGEGCGLAMAEGYVLAGELARSGGDHVAAFSQYETRLMPFLKKKQESAVKFASSFAPKTAAGIVVRDLVSSALHLPFLANFVIGRDLQDDITIPEYRFGEA